MNTLTQSGLPDRETINAWRHCAVNAWFDASIYDAPDGWSLSGADPAQMLRCFPGLQLREGFALRGYQFKEGDNGNGLVLPLAPDFAAWEFLPDPPAQAGAAGVPGIMSAIAGNGSQTSYLAASIFYRECREFGALGHGIHWLDCHLLDNACWAGEFVSPAGEVLALRKEEWLWLEAIDDFNLAVSISGNRASVSFFTFHGRELPAIERHVDAYVNGFLQEASVSLVARRRND